MDLNVGWSLDGFEDLDASVNIEDTDNIEEFLNHVGSAEFESRISGQVGTVGHQELPNVCLNAVLRDIVSFDEAVCNVKGGSKVIVEREEECAKISDSAVACSVPHSNKKVRCKVMKQKSMAELGGPLSRGVLKSMRKVKRSSLLRLVTPINTLHSKFLTIPTPYEETPHTMTTH